MDFKILYKGNSGVAVRKSIRPCRQAGDYDKKFIALQYCDQKHKTFLTSNLKIGANVPHDIKSQLISLIKEFWCCFDPEDVKIPIRDYEVVIDTGNNKPVATKNRRYGMHEAPIMQKAIDALLGNDRIGLTELGEWLSRATLAPKPHQETISEIDDFIWRFCINYILVNQKIRLRYYWPHMYKYIEKMISMCAGCYLADCSIRHTRELIYSFPVDEPFKVIHADVYTIGSELGFSGHKNFMVVICGLCTFACQEPLREMNSTTFADAIMKIMLANGLAHTIIVDKDSKFMGVFAQTIKLLQINFHVASGGNHDPVFTERLFVYYNKSLKIIGISLGTNRSSTQSVALINYAYNSAPVTGTDIVRSQIAVGRIFHYPIDYATEESVNITFGVSSVENFATEQRKLLTCSREIFRVLIQETRSWHREYINKNRPDPIQYSIGDIVFVRREVQSNKSKGRVAKTSYKFNGPWKVIEKLHGASYKLQHTVKSQRFNKKHAKHLSPVPQHLIPFAPLNGADNAYQQLHKKFIDSPFKEASIEGYTPSQPWRIAADSLLTLEVQRGYWFPTLAELNHDIDIDAMNENPDTNISQVLGSSSINNIAWTDHPSDTTTPITILHGTQNSLSKLMANIIKSDDKFSLSLMMSMDARNGTSSKYALTQP